MGNFNKIISFVLGLVVIVVLLVVLATRFNLRDKFLPLTSDNKKVSITPSPTAKNQAKTQNKSQKKNQKTVVVKPTQIPASPTGSYAYHSYKTQMSADSTQTKGGVAIIPKTGAPTLLLPLVISALLGGVFLKGKGKK